MPALYIYTTPSDAVVSLTADNGQTINGTHGNFNGRDDAHLLNIPFETGGIGCSLSISADGFNSFSGRAILSTNGSIALLNMDDFHLSVAAAEPPIPGPQPPTYSGSAYEIVQQVYEKTNPNLATKEGCGKFTEDVCTALHDFNSQWWGHIKKTGAQNQYNGHAVDAIMLATGEGAGGYDIIQNSVSPEASPVLNYIGPPDLNLWYYPAAPISSTQSTKGYK